MTIGPRRTLALALALILVAALTVPTLATERSQVPAKLKWDLTALYPDSTSWARAKDALLAKIPEMGDYQGHLGDSSGNLFDALSTLMDLQARYERLRAYASQLHDQDQRKSGPLEMVQEAQQAGVKLRSATAYVRPEIIALTQAKVDSFMTADSRLAPYRPYLENILRWAPHTRTPDEEKIIAQAGLMTGAGEAVHSIFTNAELPYPTVVFAPGDTVRLDEPAYERYRVSSDRAVRLKTFHAFWSTYQGFRRTLATTLYEQVKAHIFDKEVHHFDSCVQDALFGDNIPIQVYDELVADAHKNLPTLYRYLKLRKRMMGLDQLGYEDLYAPLVKNVDLHYTPDQAMDMTLAALAPLGKAYVDTLRHGYTQGWVDWLPSTGKSSGAYSSDVYGVHPFELLNFNGTYDDVSTLAHESGHSMHSLLADEHQPFVTHDYATFVAEVASTLNENLLFHYALDHAKNDDQRLYLLGSYLDNMRTTLFRQVLFAEFELKVHQMAEDGKPLTGDSLNDLYLSLLKLYYGDSQGVTKIDPLYAVEWAYVPHFYYDFYVYQYATSMVASISIADRIRTQEEQGGYAERDAYLAMLSSGSAKYPIDLLKGAGVDMTTSGPFIEAMKEMNRIMDRIDAILQRRGVVK
jgi:oligoendopeptidase F